jgi:hypothetical protein
MSGTPPESGSCRCNMQRLPFRRVELLFVLPEASSRLVLAIAERLEMSCGVV